AVDRDRPARAVAALEGEAVGADRRDRAGDARQDDLDRIDRITAVALAGLAEADRIANLQVGEADLLSGPRDRGRAGNTDRSCPAIRGLQRKARAVDRGDRDLPETEAPETAASAVAEARAPERRTTEAAIESQAIPGAVAGVGLGT